MDIKYAKELVKSFPETYRFSNRFLFLPRKIQGKIYWLKTVPVLEYKHTYHDYEENVEYFSWDIEEWYKPR